MSQSPRLSIKSHAVTLYLKAEGLVGGKTISLNDPSGTVRLQVPRELFPQLTLTPDDMVLVTLGLVKVEVSIPPEPLAEALGQLPSGLIIPRKPN